MVRPAENNCRLSKRRANNLLSNYLPSPCPALQDYKQQIFAGWKVWKESRKNPPLPPMERERNGGSTNPTAGTRNATFEKLQFFPEVSLRWAAEAGGSCGGSQRRHERPVAQCVSTSSLTSPRTFVPNSFHNAPQSGAQDSSRQP